jgi:hypothetical protein
MPRWRSSSRPASWTAKSRANRDAPSTKITLHAFSSHHLNSAVKPALVSIGSAPETAAS